MSPAGILDQGDYLCWLPGILSQNTLTVRGCVRDGVPPIVLDELLRNRERGEEQCPAGIIARFDGQICKRSNQGVFVSCSEQALSQEPLEVCETESARRARAAAPTCPNNSLSRL